MAIALGAGHVDYMRRKPDLWTQQTFGKQTQSGNCYWQAAVVVFINADVIHLCTAVHQVRMHCNPAANALHLQHTEPQIYSRKKGPSYNEDEAH